MDFKYIQIDVNNCTTEEIKSEIARLEKLMWYNYTLQHAVKILLNSSYGVIGNKYFVCYNNDIAEAITLQGQNIIKFSDKIINHYFLNLWKDDVETHKKLGIKVTGNIKNSLTIGGDTDSCEKNTLISTKDGELTIENIYENELKTANYIEGNYNKQLIEPKDLYVLNWDNNLKYSKVKHLYRHKVNKEKWKLKTKSGKEIIVTADHSLIVFRDGKKISVRPREILITDKILSVSKDI